MSPPQRKRRFTVNWPLQYRRLAEAEWRRGLIVNMSVSGVLFEAAERLPASDPLELSILFQAPGNTGSSFVTTNGYVVRSENNSPPRVAVKFALARAK